jgi:iron(III) transport system ATP-binding protein
MADLRCSEIVASYGARRVLAGVDLVVPEGTITAILGSSGSGKTTLLRVVIGFVPVDGGVVSVGDRVVASSNGIHVAPDKRAIGYVAQEGALFPHLTVAQNVAFGLPRGERKVRGSVEEALDLVGLDRMYAKRRPQELSGGEQRRVALARALAPRPAAVLLDEPFSGLDAALRAETRAAVLAALAATGATAVLVTHDQAEALSTGREVAVLRDGRLAQTAAPDVLYRSPVDLDVARFVGDAIVMTGEAQGGSVTCVLGTLRVRGAGVDGRVQVMLRPEQIKVEEAGDAPIGARVVGHTFYGPETVLQLELLDGSTTALSARVHDGAGISVGDRIGVRVEGPVTVYPA